MKFKVNRGERYERINSLWKAFNKSKFNKRVRYKYLYSGRALLLSIQ